MANDLFLSRVTRVWQSPLWPRGVGGAARFGAARFGHKPCRHTAYTRVSKRLMESIAEIANRILDRYATAACGSITAAGNEQQLSSPSGASEQTISIHETPQNRRRRKETTQLDRVRGSKPNLVEANDERSAKMQRLRETHGFGSTGAGKEACMAEFQWRLFRFGFSEGSWKHSAICDRKCNRTCTGMCKNDGNVYTYPRSMGHMFDAHVFSKRSDIFEPGAELRALQWCTEFGNSAARRSTIWESSDENKRQKLIKKLRNDEMHGYSNFVELSKITDCPQQQIVTTSGQIGDNGSPSHGIAFAVD